MPGQNSKKRQEVRAWMEQNFHLAPSVLVQLAEAKFNVYRLKWVDAMAAEVSYPFPAKLIGCWGECGFTKAGLGWQCTEGTGCGRLVGPGDSGHAELTEYYRRANEAAQTVS